MVNSEELNELVKYHLYLEYKERLDKEIDNINLFEGIRSNTILNINTLDNYSLYEIKKIIVNLKRCEYYQTSGYQQIRK